MDLKEYFLSNARLSRSAFARFLGERRSVVDDTADDLDLPTRLTLEDVQECIFALDDCEDDGETDGDVDDDREDEEE